MRLYHKNALFLSFFWNHKYFSHIFSRILHFLIKKIKNRPKMCVGKKIYHITYIKNKGIFLSGPIEILEEKYNILDKYVIQNLNFGRKQR